MVVDWLEKYTFIWYNAAPQLVPRIYAGGVITKQSSKFLQLPRRNKRC